MKKFNYNPETLNEGLLASESEIIAGNAPKSDPSVEERDTISIGVKSAKGLIQTFIQTMKAHRLYEADHPILSNFLERLKKAFDNYFNEFDSFLLQVGEQRFSYQGEVVYENGDVRESLAFFFFKDGIREIQFFKGLGFEEIVKFLNVMRKSEYVNRLEEDLVTLLWEEDFSYILFTTVDESLDNSEAFIPATGEDLIKGLEYKGSIEGWMEEEGNNFFWIDSLGQNLSASPSQFLAHACQLTPDEMEEMDRQVQKERQTEYFSVLIQDLIEILLHLGEDIDAYENMTSFFERIIETLLQQKEVGKVVIILKNLMDTMESIVLKDKQVFAIRRILESFSRPRSVELLGEVMKSDGTPDSELILQCLQFLRKRAIEPLCILLRELDSGKWRKPVCDCLIRLSDGEIQPLNKFLLDQNPSFVCRILHILGEVGHPSTVKFLKSLVSHEDRKVREETLKALHKLGESGKDLIQEFLRDPVSEIRGKASLVLSRTVGEEALPTLTEIILSKDFYKRDYEEKASFCKALGETRSEEAIPILKKIAQKRRWVQKSKWDEMRLCAMNALKTIEGLRDLQSIH